MTKVEQSEFMVVTDGSAGEINMFFGWKICTMNGDIIDEHSGPVFGQASSLCAECYGVLSALSFFCRTMEYTASTMILVFQMYLNNVGVITRIKKQKTYSNDYSFNTLTPDWDVIAHISNILDMGNFLPTNQHIQIHHDKHKKYDDLSFQAKLNVDADLLAIEYWALNKKTTRKVIQLPVHAVQLHINGVTVNSNYFLKLKRSATEGPLL
eukprot:7440905-Ditylum_brightwellii.AAC.1